MGNYDKIHLWETMIKFIFDLIIKGVVYPKWMMAVDCLGL